MTLLKNKNFKNKKKKVKGFKMKKISDFKDGDQVFIFDNDKMFEGVVSCKNKKAKMVLYVDNEGEKRSVRLSDYIDRAVKFNRINIDDHVDEFDQCMLNNNAKDNEEQPELFDDCINNEESDLVVEGDVDDLLSDDVLDCAREFAKSEEKAIICKLDIKDGVVMYVIVSKDGDVIGNMSYLEDAVIIRNRYNCKHCSTYNDEVYNRIDTLVEELESLKSDIKGIGV